MTELFVGWLMWFLFMKNYLITVLLKLHVCREGHNTPTIKLVSEGVESRAHLNSSWKSGLFGVYVIVLLVGLVFVSNELREEYF